MSNAGQAVLTIVGTAVGAVFGNPELGFFLGSLAGQALYPTKLPSISGPKLTDNATTSAQIGDPVCELNGTFAFAGTVIYLGTVKTTASTEETGGKGGPSQDVHNTTYFQTIAVGICAGPDDGTGIGGVRRIWENGTVVYDRRPQQDGESTSDFNQRIAATDKYEMTFTFYTGTSSQLPDPTFEADKGAGNVPGFRYLAYIVYPHRQLDPTQALRHPTFRFEVFEEGSFDCVEETQYANEVLLPWGNYGDVDPRNLCNIHLYSYSESIPGTPFRHDNLAAAIGDSPNGLEDEILGWGPVRGGPQYVLMPFFGSSPTKDYTNISLWLNHSPATNKMTDIFDDRNDPFCPFIQSRVSPIWWSGSEASSYSTGNFSTAAAFHGIYTTGLLPGTGDGNCGAHDYGVQVDEAIVVTRVPQAPGNTCHPLCGEAYPPSPNLPGYCIGPDGSTIQDVEWTRTTGSFKALSTYATLEDEVVSYPHDPVLPTDDANANSQEFWQTAYNAAVAAGKMPHGLIYGVHYPVGQDFAYTAVFNRCTVAAGGVSLASIISKICRKCGYDDSQIDVSDYEGYHIDGYGLSSFMAGRDALTPLRSVGFFDAAEVDERLLFVKRGKTPVATLTQHDLGAVPYGTSDIPPAVSTAKAQDVELPRSIRVHYFATSRDYEDGEQNSPMRVGTDAVNDVDVSLAVAISDDLALQIAEIIWADAWAGRWTHSTTLDRSWLGLVPTDVVYLPVDELLYRCRITDISDASALIRTLSLTRDDDGSYVSEAVADPPQRAPAKLVVLAETILTLLDLPALRTADNEAGIYGAARRSTGGGNTWLGATIYKSISGDSWDSVANVANEATCGTLAAALPADDYGSWTTANDLIVDLQSGTLESRSLDDVLAGANTAAIGLDGRWELVQFLTATLVSGTRWKLSNLLRGRRGTEYIIGSSVAADTFVLVSGGGILRLPLDNTEIGAQRHWMAVSAGLTFATGIAQAFTGFGKALLPFSPTDGQLVTDDSNNLAYSWVRRDRLGATLASGTDVPMSEESLVFALDIYAADDLATIVRTIPATTATATYTRDQQDADFAVEHDIVVKVSQLSTLVGKGTPLSLPSAVANEGVIPVIYPPSTFTVSFTGTFDDTEDVQVALTYSPRTGLTPTAKTYTLAGSGKTVLNDYAIELTTNLSADFNSDVTISRVGAVVTVTTVLGVLTGSALLLVPGGFYHVNQTAEPITVGQSEAVYIDYGLDFEPAPATDPAYRKQGAGNINLRVSSLVESIQAQISSVGYVVAVALYNTLGIDSDSYITSLGQMLVGIKGEPWTLPSYMQDASLAYYESIPQVQNRTGVVITMKVGYIISVDSGSNPCGFGFYSRVIKDAIMPFPAGAKQKVQISIQDVYTLGNTAKLTGTIAGQVYFVKLDSNTYTYTADSTDETNGTYFRDNIYAQLKAAIDVDGDFTVTLFQSFTSIDLENKHTLYMIIERNVVNTPFTYSIGVESTMVVTAAFS